jgi:mercuric ion transport protein
MNNRTLLATGAIGGALAAVCCATPVVAIVFGAIGLTAWLSQADYVLIPALLVFLGMIGLGLYRRRIPAGASCDAASPNRASGHE